MPLPHNYHLNIVIDKLTNSIRHTRSGESFNTKASAVSLKDLENVHKRKNEWHFNWRTELRQKDRKVYKLTIDGEPEIIQGLVSVSNMGDHSYLHLAESAQSILVKTNYMKE